MAKCYRKTVSHQDKFPDHCLLTDTSEEGWGAHLGDMETSGFWSPEKSLWSSNCRELKTVHLAILNFLSVLANTNLLVFTCNTSIRTYIHHQGWTKSPNLFCLSVPLLDVCYHSGIRLKAQHTRSFECPCRPGITAMSDYPDRVDASPKCVRLYFAIVRSRTSISLQLGSSISSHLLYHHTGRESVGSRRTVIELVGGWMLNYFHLSHP